ncbi:hypothetical protein BUALT_Bualt07G0074400 [Buddleja alternifolia]|uniref:Uncharacterized protein n=1 Tax=Buddleja alternifolia TaxID=168488 RepID=A0AAV6XA79_9LAMI|nr:hypothetical protein BUALT_Bualt07G0074400 [Buddleja alternifolia]
MESSNTTLNRTTSPMNYEHETSAYVNLMAHPPPIVEKVALHPTNKILRSSSSSSSPDSPLDDPFHNDDYDDDDDTSKFEPSARGAPCVVPSTVEKSSCDISSIEAPPNQVMENPSNSPYRIPPSVFERSSSTTPMEWSTTSNESLFSIHGGNMSFTNEQYLWRSGELGGLPGQVCTSDHMFSYSAHEDGGGNVADMRSRELGLAEAVMKEVIKESEDQVYEKSTVDVNVSRRSQGSNRSNQSFAFSIATEKGASTRMPSSGRASREQTHYQPQPQRKIELQPSRDPKPKTPTATGNATQYKWFGCLPRCSLC